jgi:superfamily I DNA/RNA helicase
MSLLRQKMALPVPVGRQKEVLALPASGHLVVLGTAGSGKTTLAILRAAYLVDPETDHCGRTLLVTFNKALVAYLRSVSDGRLDGVTVETYHKFAAGYLASKGKMSSTSVCGPTVRSELIAEAVMAVAKDTPGHELLDKPVQFFCEEIQWINQHDINTVEQYQDAERVGRGSARLLSKHRPLMFEVTEAYRRLRAARGFPYDWDEVATAALRELAVDSTRRRYRHVVIDEGQDFSPIMIKSLASAVPPDGSVTLFGDVAQQIYGHRISWRTAGLRIAKPWLFRENYRNSPQIAKLGLAIFRNACPEEITDFVEPTASRADGPLPTLIRCASPDEEADLVASQVKLASKQQSVAVLVHSRAEEKLFSGRLPAGSRRLDKRMDSWHSGPGTYYGTYHSAKGLEFDMVILPFCSDSRLPDPEVALAVGDEEAARREGRLLYVGATRARSQLLITYTGQRTKLLPRAPHLYRAIRNDSRD